MFMVPAPRRVGRGVGVGETGFGPLWVRPSPASALNRSSFATIARNR